MAKSIAGMQPGRPGRPPSLNAEHVLVLRAITLEQPQSSLDEGKRPANPTLAPMPALC